MAYITKIKMEGDNNVYDIKDAEARNNVATLASFGTKNLLEIVSNSAGTATKAGVTLNFNADGSVTLDGTATATTILVFNCANGNTATSVVNEGCDNKKHIPNGEYIALCDEKNRLRIQLGYYNGSEYKMIRFDHNAKFSVSDVSIYTWIRLHVIIDSTFDNETFYPMVQPVEFFDKDSIVPFAPTNRQLYEMLSDLRKEVRNE